MIDYEMRHYYQRVYNAKPSPEIARTRPGSAGCASANATRPNKRRSSSRMTKTTSASRPSSGRTSVQTATGQLSKKKSQSNLELRQPGPPPPPPTTTRPSHYPIVRDRNLRASNHRHDHQILEDHHHPSHYWTQEYLSRSSNYPAAHVFSSDDEAAGHHHHHLFLEDNIRPGHLSRMKAPHMRASLNDLNTINNNMSAKIDRFLNVVELCEVELRDEYEMRKRKMEARKRPPWYRSMSSISNVTRSDLNSRKTSNISGHSFQGSSVSRQNRVPKKKVPAKSTGASAASQVYSNVKAPMLIKEPARPRPKRPQSSRRPSPAMSANQSRPASSVAKASSRPGTARPLKAFKAIPDYGMPDTEKVTSKLKQDRNYQPPRRKRLVKKSSKKRINRQNAANNDYEDDFEQEEDENNAVVDRGEEADNDDDEETDLRMTKQWVDDQVARGMARQKVINMNRFESHDKESSKDSAYGYSGGESRLATREPTPDTFHQAWHHNRLKRGAHQQRQRLKSHSATKSMNSKDMDSEDEKSSAYVNFVNRVTGDILKRGVYTDRSLKESLERQMKSHEGITPKEVAIISSKLRRELGIHSASTATSLNASLSETNLKDLLYQPIVRPSVQRPKVQVQIKRNGSVGPPRGYDSDNFDGLSDQELSNILYEVDLDESVIEEVLKTVRKKQSDTGVKGLLETQKSRAAKAEQPEEVPAGSLKIFDSMNISNLNISFNASNMAAAKEKKDQQRALLIKSFAKNRPGSAAPAAKKHSTASSPAARAASGKGSSRRPVSAHRQDSSSSNPDLTFQVPTAVPRAAPKASAAAKGKGKVEEHQPHSQMPDTPLHSSETPRSSSLYQAESDDEEEAKEAANKNTADEVEDSEISEDCQKDDYASDFDNEDDDEDDDNIAEEISTDQ